MSDVATFTAVVAATDSSVPDAANTTNKKKRSRSNKSPSIPTNDPNHTNDANRTSLVTFSEATTAPAGVGSSSANKRTKRTPRASTTTGTSSTGNTVVTTTVVPQAVSSRNPSAVGAIPDGDAAALQKLREDARNMATATTKGRVEKSTEENYLSTANYIARQCSTLVPLAVTLKEDNKYCLNVPVTLSSMEIFFGFIGRDFEDGSVRSKKTIDGYMSSIKYLHRLQGIPVPEDVKRFFDDFAEGYKRKIAKKKEEGVMKVQEGKVPLAMQNYSRLCGVGLFACTDRSTAASFVHVFMVLAWNLFARSINVAALRMNHMKWDNDALVIDMTRHKADQAGDRVTPKHVFANPYNPAMCPILALAIHMFSFSFKPTGDDQTKIFVKKPYDTFTKWFAEALKTLDNLAFDEEDFGTHSFRKGVATFCAGFLGGPSIIAIFLRAGWSLGEVQDRYIGFTEGGDQLCGRVAAGLDISAGAAFAVLPPAFKPNDQLTEELWETIAPGYTNSQDPSKLLCHIFWLPWSFIMILSL